jgi:hypothetical protein
LIRANRTLIVIEAKSDLEKGFNQLAVEMIAPDQCDQSDDRAVELYGALTVGGALALRGVATSG